MSSFHASCKFQMSLGKSISFVVELFAKQVVRIKYLQEMKMDCFDFKAVKIERKICHRALNNFSTFFFFVQIKLMVSQRNGIISTKMFVLVLPI